MGDDPLRLADELLPLREAVRGMVAAFVADGFTEEQTREIVTAMFRSQATP